MKIDLLATIIVVAIAVMIYTLGLFGSRITLV